MGSMGKLYFQFCHKPKTTLKTVAKKQKTLTDPAMFLCPKNSPSKNTGVDSQSHLQGIFPTQESNLGLPHFRQGLCHLNHQGSPSKRIYNFKVFIAACGLSPVAVSTWAQLFHSMQNLPGPEIEPGSPALAGRFLSTVPPRKSRRIYSFLYSE